MRHIRAIVASVVVLTLSVSSSYAQQSDVYPKVSTAVDPTSGTVGERFQLLVTATVPALENLQVLPLFDTQTSWTAIGEPEIAEIKTDSDASRTYAYTIVPFETGQVELPQVAFTYSPPGGATSTTVLSEPLWVDVNSVLSGNGSASALRDVKPPVALPVPAAVWWAGSIAIAALVALLAYILWRRYSAHIKKMLGRALTPPELALKEIEELENERLVEQKKIKEFYTRLSDTVRHYLEKAYGVQAIDLTTNELLRALDELAEEQPLQHSDNYRTAMARLAELLDEADLVKFARLMPEPGRCRKALQTGREVVGLTSYKFATEDISEKASSTVSHDDQDPPAPPPVQVPPVHVGVSE